jgi:predicted amidohydrolase YtcJ
VAQESADLVVLDARVKSMDASGRRYQAVAVKNGRISALGSNEEMHPLIGRGTTVLEGQGRSVLPGFIDAHSHWGICADTLAIAVEVGTPPVETIEQLIARGQEAAAKTPADQWIITSRRSATRPRPSWTGFPARTRSCTRRRRTR